MGSGNGEAESDSGGVERKGCCVFSVVAHHCYALEMVDFPPFLGVVELFCVA